jgi:hypothetical protein
MEKPDNKGENSRSGSESRLGGMRNPTIASGSETESEPIIEWTTHPVKRKPLVSVLVSLFIIVVVVIVYYIMSSKAFALLALLILFASLAKFYFPTTYRLTHDKITIKTVTQTLHKDWSIYRSCYPDKNGILLSPFVRPSRLENFRGLYLIFANNRDEVTQFVKAHIDMDGRSGSERSEAK